MFNFSAIHNHTRKRLVDSDPASCEYAYMLDVAKPIFTQAQLLEIVPKLKAKDLQNWISRGVIEFTDKPGKQFKRLYSIELAIALRFVTEALRFGIKPSEAFGMADVVVDALDDFLARFTPAENDDGIPQYLFEAHRLSEYRRGRVVTMPDGSIDLSIQDRDGILEEHIRVMRSDVVYFTVEVDIIIADTLNAVYRLMGGKSER